MPRRRRPTTPPALADLPAGTRVLAYLRHSPGDAQRIDSQVEALDRYVAERQWRLAHPYWVDEFREGSTDRREEFQAFLEAARAEPRPAEVILIWSFSRFARSLVLSQFHLADLRLRGYRVVSISDDIPEGDHAIIMESLIHWKNEQFLKDLSRDVKRGLRAVVTQQVQLPDGRTITGFSGGGFPPRGYRSVRVETGKKRNGDPRHNTYWDLDPVWHDRVATAWRMKADGATILDIHVATRLYHDLSTYYDLFRNRQYTGCRINGDVEVPNAHPAYVDEATFDAIGETLVRRAREMDARRLHSRFLLSGLVFCGLCGAALDSYGDRRGTDYGQVRCPNRGNRRRVLARGGEPCTLPTISRRKLETAVLTALHDQVLTAENVAQLVERANREIDERADELEHERGEMERQISGLDRRIERLLDDLEACEDRQQSAGIRRRLGERQREREAAAGKLASLEAGARTRRRLVVTPEVVAAVLEDLRTVLAEDETGERRTVLAALVKRVTVYPDGIDLAYTFPLNGALGYNSGYPQGNADPVAVSGVIRIARFPAPRSCPVCGSPLSLHQLRRGVVFCSRACAQRSDEKRQRMREVAMDMGLARERGRFTAG